uniref:DUF4604 domain-containing protein n=1 Tax=Panagrolaimus sp. ES5 TaxID=591445 RepID=A0AC34FXK6_9BILA
MSNKQQDKPLNYQQRQSIRYVDNGDPPFIKKMKQGMGYRETTVEDKFEPETKQTKEEEKEEDDIRNLKEEDRPQVVVLNEKTDITQSEFDEEVRKKEAENDKKKIEEGKITFIKPTKRSNDESVEEAAKDEIPKDKTLKLEAERKRDDAIKKKQNKNLLSFGEEEEEEE